MGVFIFSLCSTSGKNDLHSAAFSVLTHCVCHFMIRFILISVVTVVGILSYTIFCSSTSWAASLASLSATSFDSIPLCAFTHPKWIDQFCVVRCCTSFLISSVKKLCVEMFFSKARVTLLSVYIATILLPRSSSCSSDFRIAWITTEYIINVSSSRRSNLCTQPKMKNSRNRKYWRSWRSSTLAKHPRGHPEQRCPTAYF